MVDNTNVAVDTDNLDDFELLLNGKANVAESKEEPVVIEVEDEGTPEDNPLAPEQNDAPSDEGEDEVDIPADEQKESPNLKLKPKKKSAQERIDELTAARRAAEREVEDLRRRLEEKDSQPKEVETKAAPVVADGPTPDDLSDDGEPKYPLGEFDPGYIRDLTRFTLQQERDAIKAQEAAERQAEQERAAVAEIQRGWQERLAAAQESLPDIQEKGMALEATFESLDPAYGQYLAQTIMAMENGPQVLYYLSDHLEEAQAIVAGGPLKATLGLGELNAMFKNKAETPVKVTKAPEPPQTLARGSGGKAEVPDDTDDLEAFAKKFYGR